MASRSTSTTSQESDITEPSSITSVASEEKTTSSKQQTVHYHDWPNTQGFDTHYEERTPIELDVKGCIPAYAAGVLFRTGLGPRTIDSKGKVVTKTNHWFDAISQVHRFQIHPPLQSTGSVRVTYNSRITADGLVARAQKTGKLDMITFAAKYDPCKSFFSKVLSVFERAPKDAPNEVNNAITMSINFPGLTRSGTAASKGHDPLSITTLCNKTDATRIQMLDPETLEPIGLANQNVLHPELVGIASGAHTKSDPITGDVYNYNLDFKGPNSVYRVFRVSAATGKTTILATFNHAPAYLHSFFLSENYVILCIWNSHYKAGGVSILWTKNLLDAMYFNDKVPAVWYVIDKLCPTTQGGRGIITKYESEPFFSFHTINAYEEQQPNGQIDIIADLSIYQDLKFIHHFYTDNLLSDSPKAKEIIISQEMPEIRPNLRRYRLSDIPLQESSPQTLPSQQPPRTALIEFASPNHTAPELPTINFNHITKPHRYIYGVLFGSGEQSTFIDGLIKHDVHTHEIKTWIVHGHTPGEAIFIPNPNPILDDRGEAQEDDGVLLTVVLDGLKDESYLLCLDARDLSEVGRAAVPGVIGFGFHGAFSGDSSTSKKIMDGGNEAVVYRHIDC